MGKNIVANRPLSGVELKQIIKSDIDKILDQDGMLVHHIAFSRVSYSITIKLHLDNPSYPEHVSTTTSRRASVKELEDNPDREAVEAFPLAEPSDEVAK